MAQAFWEWERGAAGGGAVVFRAGVARRRSPSPPSEGRGVAMAASAFSRACGGLRPMRSGGAIAECTTRRRPLAIPAPSAWLRASPTAAPGLVARRAPRGGAPLARPPRAMRGGGCRERLRRGDLETPQGQIVGITWATGGSQHIGMGPLSLLASSGLHPMFWSLQTTCESVWQAWRSSCSLSPSCLAVSCGGVAYMHEARQLLNLADRLVLHRLTVGVS